MKTEEVRKIVNQLRTEKHYFSKTALKSVLDESMLQIKRQALSHFEKKSEHVCWLVDNLNFLETVKKSICIKRCRICTDFYDFLKISIVQLDFLGTKEDVFLLLDEFSKVRDFHENEIDSLKEAFLISCINQIGSVLIEKPNKVPSLIRSLHNLNRIDFSKIAVFFSPMERILRNDPVYPDMTKSTRAQYREKIKRNAKKMKIAPEALAEKIYIQSKRDGKHIGFYLEKKKTSVMYFPLIYGLVLILTVALSIIFRSWLFLFFLAPILYFPVKSLIDSIYSSLFREVALPSMKCESVSEKEKTCVVITSLVTSREDVSDLIKKIQKYARNNKKADDKLYFGLLCDLPQSQKEKCDDDESLICFLESEVNRINQNEECFFAIIRKRVFHKSENAFVGWERKRGAIEQLVAILSENKHPETHFFFGNKDVIGSKYLITLDSDTELGIGQAKRLIGRMVHPLNQAVVTKLSNGKYYVTSGYGVLQPKVSASLLNPITTPFAKIFSNGAGKIPYAGASFDSMQSLFFEGNFCGKGIIDLKAYAKVLFNAFPEQRVLSHDMPEGAFLRCGIISDEFFLDSDPQTAISSDKRLHRWIRGDIQNLFLFKYLSVFRRLFAFENLLRYFVPSIELLLLLISSFVSFRSFVCSVCIILFAEFFSLIQLSFSFLISGNFQMFGRRFRKKIHNQLWNSFYICFFSFSGIVHKAIYYSDAILRSTYRILISKKKLLEWQTYSPFTIGKKDPLLFYMPSLIFSIIILFFASNPIMLLIAIIFVFYPFIMLAISEKYQISDRLSLREKEELKEMARKEFLFFENTVNDQSSFLPPDNIQFEPIEKIANRTSPTNIGLYLASLISAVDLEIITIKEALKKLEKAFESIEKMEHYHGHLFNWYDLSTLGVIGERFISTVDSGNYIASLIIVSRALTEWQEVHPEIVHLRSRIDREIENANFKILFDWTENLFFVGVFPDEEQKGSSHYDLYMSEARITSYLAITLGQVSPSHWHETQRPVLSFSGRVGTGSWTGTCFEYFMPLLFFPIIENSLDDESLEFAFFCQKKYSATSEFGNVFGISESGYNKTDLEGNLQYMAFGVPYLAINDRQFDNRVISPYSSFLMLQTGGKAVLENLNRLKMLGADGPMGFYESVDFNSNFIDDYAVVKSYMAHHKGMGFLALSNALCDNRNVERFFSREGAREKIELLGERFPLEGKIYHRKKGEEGHKRKEIFTKNEAYSKKKKCENGTLVSDGKLTLVAYDDASNRVIFDSLDIFSPSFGISVRILNESGDVLFDFNSGENGRILYSPLGSEQIIKNKKRSAILQLCPLFTKKALYQRLELNGIGERCRVEIQFDLMLMKKSEYEAHPAFHNLSLEGSSDGKTLFLRRRGINKHKEIWIYSNRAMKTQLYGLPPTETFGLRPLFNSKVRLLIDLESAENQVIPLIFSFENNSENLISECLDGSLHLNKEMKEISSQKFRRINEICRENDLSNQCLNQLLLLKNSSVNFYLGRDAGKRKSHLWQYGVSGDYPMISIYLSSGEKNDLELAGNYISAYKKLFLSGICDYDLIILHRKGDGYFDRVRDSLSDLASNCKIDFLIGKHPGIHFVAMPTEDFSFWKSASVYFIGADGKSLLQEIPTDHLKPEDVICFKNDVRKKVGRFLKNGFVIEKDRFDPNVPLSHVISGKRSGFVCNQNSLGFTWYRNAGLNRLSKWNNLCNEDDGEKIMLLRDGKAYDLLKIAKKVSFLDALAVFEGSVFDERFCILAQIVEKAEVKKIEVFLSDKLKSNSKIIFSFVPSLGRMMKQNYNIDQKDTLVVIHSVITEEYDDSAFVFCPNAAPEVFSDGERLCFAADGKDVDAFYLGGFTGKDHLDFLKDKLSEGTEKNENIVFPDEEVKQPSMEFWLDYQVKHARFYGRTGQYQSSGAFGFRDQLQDCLIFLENDPKIAGIHLIRCASHQFAEGDVFHWWHPIRNKERWDPGVRTRCSDDYLWLLYGFSEYIAKTGDEAILQAKAPFLIAEELKNNENERYLVAKLGERAAISEHLERAVNLFMNRGLGPNQLPYIGCGDWNDGMNSVNGESVWLGFFGAICLNRIKKYLSKSVQNKIETFLSHLKKGLENSYNGVWFVRAFRENGMILGDDVTLESECSIDLITQAFSAFYFLEFRGSEYSLNETDVVSSLKAAYDILADKENRVIKLFTKPFVNLEPTPGYIQRYCGGLRENGGQYTHAAVWFAMALLKIGVFCNLPDLTNKAKELTDLLDPSLNNETELFKKYQREPYVLCGDIYDANGLRGHGGWSWYTGAASWYLRLLKEWQKIEDKS